MGPYLNNETSRSLSSPSVGLEACGRAPTHPEEVDKLMGKRQLPPVGTRSPLPRRMQFAFINSEARYWTLAKYADLRQAERDGMYEDEKAVRMTWARIALMEFICGLPRGTGRQPYADGATDEIMNRGLAS